MAETFFETLAYKAVTLRGGVIWLQQKSTKREATFVSEAAQDLLRDVREVQNVYENADATLRDRAINQTCTLYFCAALNRGAVK